MRWTKVDEEVPSLAGAEFTLALDNRQEVTVVDNTGDAGYQPRHRHPDRALRRPRARLRDVDPDRERCPARLHRLGRRAGLHGLGDRGRSTSGRSSTR